jgi:hypothetical protein
MFFTSLVAKRSGAECDPGVRRCCRQPFRTQCPNALFTCRPSRATRTRARLHKDGEVPVYKKQRANGLGAQPRCRPLPAVLGQSTRNNDAKPASDERRKKDAPACFLRRSWRNDLARSVTPGPGHAVGNHFAPNAPMLCSPVVQAGLPELGRDCTRMARCPCTRSSAPTDLEPSQGADRFPQSLASPRAITTRSRHPTNDVKKMHLHVFYVARGETIWRGV